MEWDAQRRRPVIPAAVRQRRIERENAVDTEIALVGEQRQQRRMAHEIDGTRLLFAQDLGIADELDHVAVPGLPADQQGLPGQRFAGPARTRHARGKRRIPAARLQTSPAFLVTPLAQQQVSQIEAGIRLRGVQRHGRPVTLLRLRLALHLGVQNPKVAPRQGRPRTHRDRPHAHRLGLLEALRGRQQRAERQRRLQTVRRPFQRPPQPNLRLHRLATLVQHIAQIRRRLRQMGHETQRLAKTRLRHVVTALGKMPGALHETGLGIGSLWIRIRNERGHRYTQASGEVSGDYRLRSANHPVD